MPSIRIHVDGGFAVGTARINRGASRTATNRTSTPVRHHHRSGCGRRGGPTFSCLLYSARNRASVCNHSPMIRARCSRSFGQVFGKT